MTELLDKYNNARKTGTSTVFKIRDFQSTKLPIFNKDESFVMEALLDFQQSKGLIKIQDDGVTITQRGLNSVKQSKENWGS
jgi:hypothetical protein